MTLKQTRKQFIDAIGVAATHALQDGATLGVLLGLSLTFPPAIALLAAGLGIDGVRPRRLIAKADEIVREEDIKPNPEYFAGGFIAGAVAGVAVGMVLAAAAAWSGVSIPALG